MTTINIGTIGNFAGNLGVDQTARDVTLTTESKESLKSLVNQLEDSFDNFVAVGAERQSLRDALDAFKSEACSRSPKSSRIKSLLDDVRTALTGASGNLIADGAKALIAAAARAIG